MRITYPQINRPEINISDNIGMEIVMEVGSHCCWTMNLMNEILS